MTTRSPSGTPPPDTASIGGTEVDLTPLVEAVCDRYYEEFPDEHQRYGDAGVEWCQHDNRWLIWWAAYDVLGAIDLIKEATWLARILFARNFPVERLVRNLRIAADTVDGQGLGEDGASVASRLRGAAVAIARLNLAQAAPPKEDSPAG